jgi:hypothetical protein
MTDQPRSFVCCHTSRKLRGKRAKVKIKETAEQGKKGTQERKGKGTKKKG